MPLPVAVDVLGRLKMGPLKQSIPGSSQINDLAKREVARDQGSLRFRKRS